MRIGGRVAATVFVAVLTEATPGASGQFDDPANWAAFDAGAHGVGTDPDGYMDSVFDGRYVYFSPAHNGTSFHGEVLRFDTQGGFSDSDAWEAYDPGLNGVGQRPDGYWGCEFDGRYVYFAPFASIHGNHGEVMRYDTTAPFSETTSWMAYDPGRWSVGDDPDGYFDAVFDGRYVYFTPGHNGTSRHSEVLRYDTSASFTTTSSWTTYDPADDGIGNHMGGYFGGVYDGRFVYFVPVENDAGMHGEVLRYDPLGEFSDPGSWAAFDPGDHGVGNDPDGYIRGTFDGRYLYFSPFYNGTEDHAEVLRYDTEGDFSDIVSWTTFDLRAAGVVSEPHAFAGAIFDGRYVYFPPHSDDVPGAEQVVRYDTTGSFADGLSWSVFNPVSVGSGVDGRYGGVFDGRYIYLVPANWSQSQHGEVLRYDTGTAEQVPAVSEWGLVVMTLLLLTAATFRIREPFARSALQNAGRARMIVGALGAAIALGGTPALGDVQMEWVVIGDPGNIGELRGAGAGGDGPDRVAGAVDYSFRIGTYEVTNEQYIEFLNAVAAIEDTFDLYNTTGQEGGMPGTYGGVERAGVAGDYHYGPKDDDSEWLNRPVNFISFYDALRFANWMHNGQHNGLQDPTTTEDGAYDMSLGANVARKAGARFFIPSEDECFKAGYYRGGGTTAGYWDFQTQSDTPPVCEAPPGGPEPPGSAHYYCGDGQAVGPPYYTTEVGAYAYSPGPYGTFDHAGNMGEWGEDLIDDNRIACGLPWGAYEHGLRAAVRVGMDPLAPGGYHIGFRLAGIYEPEPIPTVSEWGLVTMALLLLSAGTVIVIRVGSTCPVRTQAYRSVWRGRRLARTLACVGPVATASLLNAPTYGQDPALQCPPDSVHAQPVDIDGAFVASDHETEQIWYDNFSAIAEPLCALRWWGLNLHSSDGVNLQPCTESPMTFDITFYSDAAGAPGTEVCAYSVEASGSIVGEVAGWNLYRYDELLDSCCDVTDGWVSIVGSGDPLCWFFWGTSTDGDDLGCVDSGMGIDCATGEHYYDLSTCMGGSEPVPTVSEWGLVVLTLLLLSAGTIATVGKKRRLQAV